jgi:hypothetical protein
MMGAQDKVIVLLETEVCLVVAEVVVVPLSLLVADMAALELFGREIHARTHQLVQVINNDPVYTN